MEVDKSRRPPTPLPMLEHESDVALENLRTNVDSLELLRQRKRELELLLRLRARTLTVAAGDMESQSTTNNGKSFSRAIGLVDKMPKSEGLDDAKLATQKRKKSIRFRSIHLKEMEDVSSVSCSGLDDSTSDQSSHSDLSGPSHESDKSRHTALRKMLRINSCKWLAGRNGHQGMGEPKKPIPGQRATTAQDAKLIVVADSQEAHISDSYTWRSVATTTVTSATSDFSSFNEDVELAYPKEKLLPHSASSSIATTPSSAFKPEKQEDHGPNKSLNAISVAVCDVSTITATSENEVKKPVCRFISFIVFLLILFLGALLAVLALIMKAVILRNKKI